MSDDRRMCLALTLHSRPTNRRRSEWTGSVNLPEQPLEARQVLAVMAGEVVDERAQRQGAVLAERAAALELLVGDIVQKPERRGAGVAERSEDFLRIGVVVVAVGGEVVAIERDESRLVLVEHAVDAHLVAGDLDVAHVAELPEWRETLAGNAFP